MIHPLLVRGPLLNPQPDGCVSFFADGAIVALRDDRGTSTIRFVGDYADLPPVFRDLPITHRANGSVFLPPFLDIHTHLPQHPIRGRFVEGIDGDPVEGRLLAGLRRNVFPEEARHADAEYAAEVFRAFHADALSHGVVGGAAYGTVHPGAAHAALGILPPLWSVGMVLMNTNCPEYLRTDETTIDDDLTHLADAFGKRLIVTDRFAVSVTTPLRTRAAYRAGALGLRMQTHLNEQVAEKSFIEHDLYPGYASYTDVYRHDGLLDHQAIVAHCIQMTPPEWRMLADHSAVVAHCPTSNTLLGSGTMPLDDLPPNVAYALGTDVGASPTCSMLAEMAQFLKVHGDGRSSRATPEEALFRATLAPAQILGVDGVAGRFAVGMPLTYIEVKLEDRAAVPHSAGEAIWGMVGSLSPLPPSQPVASSLSGKGEDRTRQEGQVSYLPNSNSPFPERELATGWEGGRGDRDPKEALAHLAAYGLPHGPDLALLTADVHDTANRLEKRVLRVVQNGEMIFQRATEADAA